MTQQNNRRDFLKTTAAAGAGFWIAGQAAGQQRAAGPNERVNVAFVAAGGRANGNIGGIAGTNLANIVALCDVDRNRAGGSFNRYRNARQFADYRRMFDRMANQIDAVVVSTPDHMHAHASIAAMLLGKHVYCEKPLTHSVWEARQMKEVAARQRVKTQMGNQGTSHDGFREGVEVIRSGALGTVREVHVWTNRPIWPQSEIWQQLNREPAPLQGTDVPQNLSWDLWLGAAPQRPYAEFPQQIRARNRGAYHFFNWRGWWDFGTGAIGDMACHTMNLPFMALNLDAPTSVTAELDDRPHNRNNQTAPHGCMVTYQFPARGDRAALTFKWYERRRPEARLLLGQRPGGSGCLIVGTRGTLYTGNDYGSGYRLLPAERFQNFQRPERTLPRVDGAHHREWLEAIRSDRQAMSNFDYASALTETALLGNVAIRCGRQFNWNARELRASVDVANRYVRRDYRRGWDLSVR